MKAKSFGLAFFFFREMRFFRLFGTRASERCSSGQVRDLSLRGFCWFQQEALAFFLFA
jgi:hypothetical protein